MTLPGHQIRFNNDKVIANTREELLHQGEIRRNFIFKGYKTEKERIVSTFLSSFTLFIGRRFKKQSIYRLQVLPNTNVSIKAHEHEISS
jgi:hypothetical protein